MKNEEKWKPSIVYKKNDSFKIDKRFISKSSYFIVKHKLPVYNINISKYSKGDFLDCGCGKQPYYEMYKDKVTSITCIDWGESMHENPHLDFQVDLNKKLDFEDSTFDSILLSDVLEHIYTPNSLILELIRVLRSGGNLMIFVPYMYLLHETPHDYYRYTEYYFRKIAEDHNLKLKEVIPWGGILDVFCDLLNKTLFRGNSFFLLKPFVAITKVGFLKRINNRTSKTIPTGYFILFSK